MLQIIERIILSFLILFIACAGYIAQAEDYKDFSSFPKWVKVLPYISYAAPGKPPVSYIQIQRVHSDINRISYVPDLVDDWKDPARFKMQGGDCEDYAIAKMDALARMGVTDNDMLLLVVMKRGTQQLHAILKVYYNNQWLILDNESEQVRTEAYMQNFIVFYGINRSGWIRP